MRQEAAQFGVVAGQRSLFPPLPISSVVSKNGGQGNLQSYKIHVLRRIFQNECVVDNVSSSISLAPLWPQVKQDP